jgi:hypothetical protein
MDIRDAELAESYNEFIIIILQIQHAVQMDMPLPTAASIPRDEQDKCLGKKKKCMATGCPHMLSVYLSTE